ncbi:MAG: hypothetical protein OEY14_01460 [Myxococcales bacterium]|nr:hypothetical protein [Myxococcales bacterium]
MDRLGRLAALMALVLAVACGDRPAPDASAGARSSSGAQGPRPLGDPAAPGQPPGAQPPGAPPPAAASGAASPGEAELEAGWPLHGLVTGTQLVVRDAPDPEAGILGWLRVGSRLRARSGRVQTPTCSTGWVQIHPRGWACAGQGITIEEAPPEAPFEVAPPDREAALPYAYYFVKEPMVPQYHRLPSREAQRESAAFADATSSYSNATLAGPRVCSKGSSAATSQRGPRSSPATSAVASSWPAAASRAWRGASSCAP